MSSSKPTQFFTWSDVQNCIYSGSSIPFPVQVDASGVYIYGNHQDKSKIRKELSRKFEAAYNERNDTITLVGTSKESRQLPVEVLPAEDVPDWLLQLPPKRPLWSDRWPLNKDHELPPSNDNNPKVVTFFSFKGGVGRTTACFATAIRLLSNEANHKVLYVDADLEAPGLTWLSENAPDGNAWSEKLSWVDALALVHGAENWKEEALPIITEQMEQSTISLELKSGRREFFFMPAVRSTDQIEQMPVTPEQVVRARGRAWVIGDLLIELGNQLKVDVILVDLRAGITEFSSPLLLDPRTHNVIVSSCSKQSVSGVCRVLDKINDHTVESINAKNLINMTFLITLVPPPSKPIGDEVFAKVQKDILNAWSKLNEFPEVDEKDNEKEDDIMPEVCRIDHDTDLIIFDNLESLAQRLPETGLWSNLELLVDQLIISKSSSNQTFQDQDEKDKVRNRIIDLTQEHLTFGEQNQESEILATLPIRRLIKSQAGQLPIAVILGSKGAGKTFLWSQLLIATTFERFSDKVKSNNLEKSSKSTLIFPLLSSKNPSNRLMEIINNAEKTILGRRKKKLEIFDLSSKLEKTDSCCDGMSFWIRVISERLGLSEKSDSDISLREIDEKLRKQNQHLILAVDGLEDALQRNPNESMSESHKVIVRALILDLPNQLHAMQTKHLGIIVFIRYDLARECIPQNFDQFEARYRSLALNWNKEDALRLVLWILQKSEWPSLSSRFIDDPYEKLKEELKPFWGERMGGEKKAFTDRWITTVLSDLNGRFQARDIIRFLHRATKESLGFPLKPTAMRKAIDFCSEEKIEELKREVRSLKDIFNKLKSLPKDKKTIPMNRLDVLSAREEDFLIDQGLLYKDGDSLYMPEIIWKGLGFRQLRKGRIGAIHLRQLATSKRSI